MHKVTVSPHLKSKKVTTLYQSWYLVNISTGMQSTHRWGGETVHLHYMALPRCAVSITSNAYPVYYS